MTHIHLLNVGTYSNTNIDTGHLDKRNYDINNVIRHKPRRSQLSPRESYQSNPYFPLGT